MIAECLHVYLVISDGKRDMIMVLKHKSICFSFPFFKEPSNVNRNKNISQRLKVDQMCSIKQRTFIRVFRKLELTN